MQDVINFIPFMDLGIIALVLFFMFVGWKQGLTRMIITVGALYTGFLLASVYYHLFAVVLANMLKDRVDMTFDLIAFVMLDTLISALMLALLLNLFGHIEIKGRAMVFGKMGGLVAGLVAGVFIVGSLVTLLRVPAVSNTEKLNDTVNLPVVQVFNNGYARSALAPNIVKAAPFVIRTASPFLPPRERAKGAVPLLQSMLNNNER
ncbi:MAG: CvpA family protein [Chloroflexota bacterium]|nr:CvpA family protein [Chloroflexota bacterium]MDQ5867138.1 CvpA family protein [Chloroflexota bacterium]